MTAPATATSASDLLGSAPGFYGTMRHLRFGMSREEARKAAPALFVSRRTSYDPVLYGFSFHPVRGFDGLHLHFMVPQRGVSRGLTAAWGPPQSCTPVRAPGSATKPLTTRVWIEPKAGLSVALMSDRAGRAERLRFDPYVDLHRVWGSGLLGLSASRVVKRLGGRLSKKSYSADLRLPGPAYSDGLALRWQAPKGRIASVEFRLDARSCVEAASGLDRHVRGFAASVKGRVQVDQPAAGRWRIRINTADLH